MFVAFGTPPPPPPTTGTLYPARVIMFYVAARTCTVQCVSFVSLHRTSYKFLSYGSPKPPNAFRRAVALIKSFAIGTKDLFYDIKNIFKLQRRSGMLKLTDAAPKRVGPGKSNFPFSRRELQFIYRVCVVSQATPFSVYLRFVQGKRSGKLPYHFGSVPRSWRTNQIAVQK